MGIFAGISGLIICAGLVLGTAPAVHGDEKPATIRLELTSLGRPAQALAKPRPDTIREDAARVISEIETRQRVEKLIGETIPGPQRRPDLNYDLFSAIQSRHLIDILRVR
ncbi:MAG: hypothetical protein ACE5JD_13455 [Candidatus Methylomirabilia bacterium]